MKTRLPRAPFGKTSRELLAFARENRRRPSFAEAVLWNRLRGRQLGVRIRRQRIASGYIADFHVNNLSIIIEIDGSSHANEMALDRDQRRDIWLRSQGFKILRFSNRQVLHDLDTVVMTIKTAIVDALSNRDPINCEKGSLT